jgi:hypothetical protein
LDHRRLDREIEHLEYVFNRLYVPGPLPLSYWRDRLTKLRIARPVPAQRVRLIKLEQTLQAIEQAGLTADADLLVQADGLHARQDGQSVQDLGACGKASRGFQPLMPERVHQTFA